MSSIKSSSSIGILITNLGTPHAPTPKAVRKYLSEFLWDPHVVQLPRLLWWPLLHGLILPFRSKKSAKLYEKIWTPSGSPLLTFSQALSKKLEEKLQEHSTIFKVVLGMRYGEPSLLDALQGLQQQSVTELLVLPLYPQYSRATTLSTQVAISKYLRQLNWSPRLQYVQHYAQDPRYIAALVHSIKAHWHQYSAGEKLVFSFHGLPQKNIIQGDPYYDQCQSTAQLVAQKLQLAKHQWDVVFQSRFGREKWLEPYCDRYLQELPKKGYQRIDIICPGFAVDCLETLEEIAITNRAIFCQSGGLTYHYIPALNATEPHVEALVGILLDHLKQMAA